MRSLATRSGSRGHVVSVDPAWKLMTYRGDGAVYRWYLETELPGRLVWPQGRIGRLDLIALGRPLLAVAYASGPGPESAARMDAWRAAGNSLPGSDPGIETVQLETGEQLTILDYQ